jgi:outer membrane immunogenic protein
MIRFEEVMLKFAAALMACLTSSAAALAADGPNGSGSLLTSETAYNWAGIYAGASAAVAWDEMTVQKAVPAFGVSKVNGFVGGPQIGFNKQYRNLVFGLEADFSLTNVRGDNTNAVAGKYGTFTLAGVGTLETRLSSMRTVRARFGYASGAKLLYATAGYAFGRTQLEMSGTMTAGSNTAAQAGSSMQSMTGWALGAGFEYAFARGMSMKAEYIRVQFNESTFFTGTWAVSPGKASIDLFRFGSNFRI